MDPTNETYRAARLNVLAAAAFIVVVLCLFIVVYMTIKDEFAKGIITLILGRFLGYVDNVYQFEFGTTRGSKAKDDVITNLSASSPNAPSVVRDAVVSAVSPGSAAKTETMNVAAESVTVNPPSKGNTP